MPTALRNALAKAIRNERLRHGRTQEELAHICGIHRTYVSMLERGLKSPTVEVLSRIARALDVRPSALLSAAEKSSRQPEGSRQ